MSAYEKYERAIEEAGYESFRTLDEHWAVYALRDGSYLRMRVNVIKRVRQTDVAGNTGFNLNANVTLGIVAPKSLRGTPSPGPPTQQELATAIVDDDLGFTAVEDEWSRHQMKDGIVISVRLILVKISRTSFYDPNGEPVYNINHQLLTKINVPEELRKKGVQVQQPNASSRPTFIA
jgi:hypothetical protein